MSKSNRQELTPRQLHFCRSVASGMTQAAAYREAFDCQEGSLSKTQQESASRLMANPKIRARVDQLIKARERGMIVSCLSDKERVLTKLRALLDAAEGTPAEQVMLRAADLLGKSAGMDRDVTETVQQRSAEDIQAELKERLQQLSGASAVH